MFHSGIYEVFFYIPMHPWHSDMEYIPEKCKQTEHLGSMVVSRKLPTYPSPNLTFCPKKEVSVNVRLGERQVDSFPETIIDPEFVFISVFVFPCCRNQGICSSSIQFTTVCGQDRSLSYQITCGKHSATVRSLPC